MRIRTPTFLALLVISAGTGLPALAGRTVEVTNLDKKEQVTVCFEEKWQNREGLPYYTHVIVLKLGPGKTRTERTNSGKRTILARWQINGSAWKNVGDLAGTTYEREVDSDERPAVGVDGIHDWKFEVSRDPPGAPWNLRMVGGRKRLPP